jgi:hypothetical protein
MHGISSILVVLNQTNLYTIINNIYAFKYIMSVVILCS